jgi:hypothetical protein
VTELLTIVPTRSRPESLGRVIAAWEETGAFDEGGELLFVIDHDDPRFDEYLAATASNGRPEGVFVRSVPRWKPLVPKLNGTAAHHARRLPPPFAVGFAGDDHLPRTKGWVGRYLGALYSAGTGIVYCDDGYQGENIPTQWAMTSDIVRALGRMVPAPVEHLYCDNAVRDLGKAAECLTYLPDVLIEHMHPVVGKAETDEQYQRVNGKEQYRNDRAAYRGWARSGSNSGLAADVRTVRALIEQGESI